MEGNSGYQFYDGGQGGPSDSLPEDTVYIASQPFRQGDTELMLDLRETLDGKRAVMAYSSLATLVAGAGEKQPWIAFPKAQLSELVEESGTDDVLLDTVIAPGLRHGDSDGTQRWRTPTSTPPLSRISPPASAMRAPGLTAPTRHLTRLKQKKRPVSWQRC